MADILLADIMADILRVIPQYQLFVLNLQCNPAEIS